MEKNVTDSVVHRGMVAALARWSQLLRQRNEQSEIVEAARDRMYEIDKLISDCQAACRAFGFDPDDDEAWQEVRRRFIPEVSRLLGSSSREDDQESPKFYAGSATRPRLSSTPKIKDLVLERLKQTGAEGAKAAEIRKYIKDSHSIDTHEKTVGMTLYRLLKADLVRREGHRWFFVASERAETENPGVGAPGSG